jgi:hypothetical protein
MLHRWVAVVGLGALGLSACGASGVHFAGQSQDSVVEAAAVRSLDVAPAGQRRLGRLTVGCTRLAAGEDWDQARLSDLSCGAALLSAAMRQRAAQVGGVFLVQPQCGTPDTTGAARLVCAAEVWGPSRVAEFRAPPVAAPPLNVDPRAPAAPGAPELALADEAWRVSVERWPPAGQPRRTAMDPEHIVEVDFAPVGQISFGDLRATCQEACAESSVRMGLVAAAAQLGATHLVDVRCVEAGEGRVCVASAAGPQVLAEPLAEAR